MSNNEIVSRDDWLEARKDLLASEKEFTRLREELTRKRQQLPWVRIDKDYVFEGPGGGESLADLFAGRKQLLIYHFMFGPDWDAATSMKISYRESRVPACADRSAE